MKWGRWFTGALRALRGAAGNGDRAVSPHGPAFLPTTSSAAWSGPALRTSLPYAPAGRPQPDLRARAERVCNRNRRLVERYLAVHRALMNGRGAGYERRSGEAA